MTRSGVPICDPWGKIGIAGISEESPTAHPSSTQRAIKSISSCVNTFSSTK